MKLDLHGAVLIATALLCLVAQGVHATPPEKNEVKPVNAASIKQAATPQQSDATIAEAAAAAARRDHDQDVNGSVGEWRPMSPDTNSRTQ